MPTNQLSTLGEAWYRPFAASNNGPALVALVRVPHGGHTFRVTELVAQVDAANEQLERDGSGWRFDPEREAPHPAVVPLVLTWFAVDHEPYPEPGSLLRLLSGRVSLDPLLEGAPAYKPHAVTRGDFGRVPVAVLTGPPPRRPRSQVAGRRRPVVALLDTAVVDHDWLGEADATVGGDGFWVDAGRMGWKPGPRLKASPPPSAGQLLGRELGSQEGHGTFSAALIRQVAPDAQVLAMHTIGDDGAVYGDHVVNALAWLLDNDNPLVAGDVVCLPMGFQPVLPMDSVYLGWLADVLGQLGDNGVRVVASAGNDGENIPVYPAAFANAANPPAQPLVSVGAYNPDGKTPAYFSNYGDWVKQWEIGTSVISAFPRVNGAARSELLSEEDGRESADPDDFTGGFARWSGTSFAAVIYAGKLAQQAVEPEVAHATRRAADIA